MSDIVKTEVIGNLGLISLNNPPVNAASAGLRAGLVDALAALENAVEVIAVYGAGRSFIAGADIREFGKPPTEPWLPEVCLRIENAAVPVVAVLHGAALGGGLEVAIAAHARIAIPGVQLGFPEVTLGIIPGAGGTQRGPRLIGTQAALDLITTGRRIDAADAAKLGLIDTVREGAPRDVALAAAQDVLDGKLATRRTADIHVNVDSDAINHVAKKLSKSQAHLFSPHRAVEAVAAACKPISDGLAEERRLFQLCLDSPQRAGLIHAFFAERAVAKVPEASLEPIDITRIGVIGAGTMGAGIATTFLLAGFPVVITEQSEDAVNRGAETIAHNLDAAVKRGKMSTKERANIDLQTATDFSALAGCDLVIEAVFEDLDVKKSVLEAAESAAQPALLATNTSYLNINKMATVLKAPERLLGLHFFSPAHIMRLLEIVVADATAPKATATAFAIAKRLKKVAVRSGVGEGFIGNRIMSAYRKAADFMLMDGAEMTQIDAAIRAFGFAMGPFQMVDLAGLDIAWATRKRLAATRPANIRYHGEVGDALCEAWQFGAKSGRGYYVHGGDGPTANPDLPMIINEVQRRNGITPRKFSDTDIVERYTMAMIAEAARVLEDRVAEAPVDIDAVFLFGYGFPRWRGGPMFYADTLGAKSIVASLSKLSEEDHQFWQTPPLLVQMAKDGSTFADLGVR
ncbi:MAG: 3-hydroxyacyl-CoA dehydrogenase NAD-binding domain-containing protein [Pseudomonadota bacterium]